MVKVYRTKTGQPYIKLASGKAKFISKRSAKQRRAGPRPAARSKTTKTTKRKVHHMAKKNGGGRKNGGAIHLLKVLPALKIGKEVLFGGGRGQFIGAIPAARAHGIGAGLREFTKLTIAETTGFDIDAGNFMRANVAIENLVLFGGCKVAGMVVSKTGVNRMLSKVQTATIGKPLLLA